MLYSAGGSARSTRKQVTLDGMRVTMGGASSVRKRRLFGRARARATAAVSSSCRKPAEIERANSDRASTAAGQICLDRCSMSWSLALEAEVYLCGPNRFMDDMRRRSRRPASRRRRIHAEIFNGGESMTPRSPARLGGHRIRLQATQRYGCDGFAFARSGIAARSGITSSSWKHSRAGGSLRCPGAVVLPGRCLSQLRRAVWHRDRSCTLAGSARP